MSKHNKRTIKKKKAVKVGSGHLHVYARPNNVLITLTNETNQVVSKWSSGLLGFTNCKKSSPHALQTVITTAVNDAADKFGTTKAKLIFKGSGQARDMMHYFNNNRIMITSIIERTNVAFNGVRMCRKART